MNGAALVVVDPGVGTTFQDLGRPGYAHLGVSPSGMVDPALGTLVNRLVGNADDAPVLETCGGLVVRAERAVLVATTVEAAPFILAPGETYRLPAGGRVWHYLAVRGGFLVERVLASASTDTLGHLGPARPYAGQVLGVAPDPDTEVALDVAPVPEPRHVVRCSVGPRADWFAPGWQGALAATPLTVSDVSRVGVRLTGLRLPRLRSAELPSEGLVRGAVQAPPGGELVMMLADHPTTGGYPVIAVVHPDDVAAVAQHPPGTTVTLRIDT